MERVRAHACTCVRVCVRLCVLVAGSCLIVALWTAAHQVPLSMGFSRQEYWSGLPFPTPGDLPDPGLEPASPVPPALAGGFFTLEPPGKPTWGMPMLKNSFLFI